MKHTIAVAMLLASIVSTPTWADELGPASDTPLRRALPVAVDRDPAPDPLSPAARPRKAEGIPAAAAAVPRAANTATVRGSVFYNDRRTDGLFAARRDKSGNPGLRCSIAGKRDGSGAACSLNWLGGKYMVVDVIERDEGFLPTDVNCKKEEVIASATVAYDGSYSATFSTTDACKHDKLSNNAIELRVRLRFCNSSYCFSINRDKNEPYVLAHPGASASKPLSVKAGDDKLMTTLNFSTASDPAKPNNDSIAANYYASIVDTVLMLHKDNPIPFFSDEFGEIQTIFPSTKSSTATARSPTEVAISSFQSQPTSANGAFAWVDGKTPAHEYGHILMLRAWGGDYGFDGIGISAGSTTIAPSQQIAFKEAWAEFVARAVFPLTRGCQLASYDDNGATLSCAPIQQAITALEQQRREQVAVLEHLQGAGLLAAQEQLGRIDTQLAAERARLADCQATPAIAGLPGALGEGAMWRDNIVKALCDWYDERADDDTRLAGAGDHFAAEDIYSMWFNLRRMHLDAALYGGQTKNPGLWFCDQVDYYLNVRKSVAAVGSSSHAGYESSLRDMIYNNNIGCSMGAP